MPTPALPSGARPLITADEIRQALDRLASAIDTHYAGEEIVLLTVLVGGMIPAAELALRLHTPIVLDYVHATRYHNEAGTADLRWIAKPRTAVRDRHVLIVDDILDEGPTLRAIAQWCHEQGARSVASAVLADKQHDRRVDNIRADFVGLTVPDQYVFGFGMDYRGTLRHLPSIYVLEETEEKS